MATGTSTGKNINIKKYGGTSTTLGQKAMTASMPVTLASDQSTLPVSLASVPSHAVTNAGTFVVQENGAALTALQLIDDIVYTDDTSTHATGTSKGALMMAAATPTDTAVNANDIGALAMTVNRELLVQVNTALPAGTNAIGKLSANSGVDIGDVDVTTVGTITPGTAASSLGKAEDAVHGSGDVGVMALAVGNVAQTTLAADGDYIAIAVDTKGNLLNTGNIAHDGVDAGNPLGIGYRAIAHGTNPTAVAAADRTVGYSNRAGIPFVIGGHPNIISKEFTILDSDNDQTNLALITVSAGTKIVVTKIGAYAHSSNTVGVNVRIGFGTATLPSAALAGATGIILSHPSIAAGSGVVEGNGSGIVGIGADDEDLRITCDDPVTGSIRVLVNYYTIES